MTNVFTRKSKHPKSVSLSDYCDLSERKRFSLPRIASMTRMGNPHPAGLAYQQLQDEKIFIWNPDLHQQTERLPMMLTYTDNMNFTCGKSKVVPRGKPPNVKYTETTMNRTFFKDPALKLNFKLDTTRYAHTPKETFARGIVPDLSPPYYRLLSK